MKTNKILEGLEIIKNSEMEIVDKDTGEMLDVEKFAKRVHKLIKKYKRLEAEMDEINEDYDIDLGLQVE